MNRKKIFLVFFTSLKEVGFFFSSLLLACLSFFFFDIPIAKWLYPFVPFYFGQVQICSYLISPLVSLIFSCAFLILWLVRIKHRGMRFLFETTVVQLVTVGFVRVLKVVVGRPRPSILWQPEFQKSSFSSYFQSFPSGHTMTAFALATTLSLFYPRFFFLFFMVAFCLSLSRILLLDHYLSDVFGTAALAVAITHFIHRRLQAIDPIMA